VLRAGDEGHGNDVLDNLVSIQWDETLRSARDGLGILVGTIILKFIDQGIVNTDRLAESPGEFIAQVSDVQSELMLITLSLLVSAYFAAPEDKRGKVVPPLLIGWGSSIAAIHILLISAVAYQKATGGNGKMWITNSLTIIAPDIIGLLAIGWAVYAARRIRL
jgi:hypothetical protein